MTDFEHREDVHLDKWEEQVEASRANLEKPEQREANKVLDLDSLSKALADGKLASKSLISNLGHVQETMVVFVKVMDSKVNVSLIWGLLWLMLSVRSLYP